MNWFKETWWIIKQLFTKVKADKVEYKHMDHYPFSGYSAMSWCGYLLSRKPESQIKPTTWNHENIHLYEAKDKKRWISYYWSYYLVLHDKFCETDKEPMICLRAHSSDPESLVNLLKMYLETCKY